MTIFILGGTGFIGSALAQHCQAEGYGYEVIHRANYNQWRGQSCEILINANGNSRKYLSWEDPLQDFDLSVRSVRASLEDFDCQRYIFLSSAEVYPDSSGPQTSWEDQLIEPSHQSPYGFHKYLAEQCVRHQAKSWLIFRLSGFVGPGLQKNPIFDIIHQRPLWVAPESEFQYLHTRDLSRIIFEMVGNGLAQEIINIGAQGVVRLTEVIKWARRRVITQPGSPVTRCEINIEKVRKYCEIPTSQETIQGFLRESQLY